MPQVNATVTVRHNSSLQALAELLLEKPSGVYMVTVHNRQVVKIAPVEKEIVLQPKTTAQDLTNDSN